MWPGELADRMGSQPNSACRASASPVRRGSRFPVYDRLEQARLDPAIGRRGDVLARLFKLAIGGPIQGCAGRARVDHPFGVVLDGQGAQIEAHVRETLAAELRRNSRVSPRLVRL